VGPTGDVFGVQVIDREAVEAWTIASCTTQGEPVRVTDVRVIARVKALLTGAASGAGGEGTAPRLRSPPPSEAPDGCHSSEVQATTPPNAGGNHHVARQCSHGGCLSVKGEGRPLSA